MPHKFLLRHRLVRRLDSPADVVLVAGVIATGRTVAVRQWADAEPRTEIRVLVNTPAHTGKHAFALAIASLAVRLEQDGASDIRDSAPGLVSEARDNPIAALLAVQALTHKRIAIAFTDLDWCPADDFIEQAALYRAEIPGLKIIAILTDPRQMTDAAFSAGLSVDIIEDEERLFTNEEVVLYAEQELGSLTAAARQALIRATSGHPMLVGRAVTAMRDSTLKGTLTTAMLLDAWDRPMLDGCADVPIYRMIGTCLAAPRVSIRTVRVVGGARDADYDIQRMVTLGLGSVETNSGTSERSFRWNPAWRRWMLRSSGIVEGTASIRPLTQALANAASIIGDTGLEVAAHVSGADYEQAEAALRDCFWEATGSRDLETWLPVANAPLDGIASFPLLRMIRRIVRFRMDSVNRQLRSEMTNEARHILAVRNNDPHDRLTHLTLAAHAFMLAGDTKSAADIMKRSIVLRSDMERVLLDAEPLLEASRLLLTAEQALMLGEPGYAQTYANQAASNARSSATPVADTRAAYASLLTAHLRSLAGIPLSVSERQTHAEIAALPVSSLAQAYSVAVTLWQRVDRDDFEGVRGLLAHLQVSRVPTPPTLWLTTVALAGLIEPAPALQYRTNGFGFPGELPGVAELGLCTSAGSRDLAWAVETLEHDSDWIDSSNSLDLSLLSTPRARHAALLAQSVHALRSGSLRFCLALLAQAYDVCGGRLAPLVLASCPVEERTTLARVAADAEMTAVSEHVLRALRYPEKPVDGRSPTERLSRRERELLSCLRHNLTISEIADNLQLSVSTVKFHRSNLYKKLGVSSRDEALAAAGDLFT
ncbi:regulatory protein, luxR family [Ruaniaceae bacterium KH17]|nr:regulatory protein, luxR family [Ruaniaceae bacterium KH17]